MLTRYGAPPATWDHLALTLELTEDLLPVVSNPNAVISPRSKMAALGKTPSLYNREGEVAGITSWTSHQATLDEITAWQKNPDLGICIQTRRVRAIDVDVPDPVLAQQIAELLAYRLGPLPTRMRSNSSKFLVAINLPGEYHKRVLRVAGGIVEFLATGQQFIAAGTHTSGVPYEWEGGLPTSIPTIDAAKFEALWKELDEKFSVAPASESKAPTKALKLAHAAQNDPVAVRLQEQGLVLSQARDGRLDITCPFEDGHSSQTAESATSYYPAHTGGYEQGHFHCLHASCNDRTDQEFREALGLSVADQFDVIPVAPPRSDLIEAPTSGAPTRFTFSPASEFAASVSARYIIKGVLPEAELAVIYGASASGKTFAVLDLVAAIAAKDGEWRNLRTRHGRVAYIVAEGASFFKGRLVAYARHHDVPLSDIDLHILGAAPNLLARADTAELIAALKPLGPLKVIVIDTLAQTMAGGDENTGVDVGKVLAHCKALHRHTGATVLLVHHSGKDETKGARGWSGLRAACDAELEVTRNDTLRTLRVSKQKDGADGVEFNFKLRTVAIGLDADGDTIESCVVEHTDVVPTSTNRRKLKGDLERLMHRLVLDMATPGEEQLTPGKLIDAAVLQIPFDENGGRRDQRRSHAMRALDGIKSAGYVIIEDGVIKLPTRSED